MDEQHNSDAKSSADLVARIMAGDAHAEEELVERFSRGLRFYIRNNGGRDMADDFCQETLFIALIKIREGRLREPEKLKSFIIGIAHKLLQAQARKSATHPEDSIEAAASTLSDYKTSDDYVQKSEENEFLRQALKELNPRDRALLQRAYLDEAKKQEICDELSLNAIHYNRVHYRALRRLRKEYEELLRKWRRKPPGGG